MVIRTIDTDVVVLSVATVAKFQQIELWVAFGVGANFHYFPAHEISQSIVQAMPNTLPFFHAFTGCGTVPCFSRRGKNTAWATWKLFNNTTNVFPLLSDIHCEVDDNVMETVERFVVLLYNRGSTKNGVNEARQQLFAQKGRGLDAIPPTKVVLFHHTKRAVYQAGHYRGQACNTNQQLPYPRGWEWSSCWNGQEPLWTTLPDVTANSRELVKCGCKKGCHGNCLCVNAALKCTALCACSEECY